MIATRAWRGVLPPTILRNAAGLTVSLLFVACAGAQETTACASTLGELRHLLGDAAFATHWNETSMNDGRPLRIVISEDNGALRFEFVKTGAGPWASMSGAVCKASSDFELRVARESVKLGPSANWLIGLAFSEGRVVALRWRQENQLQIETPGWSGRFVAATKD